ncbi:calcium-transporting ATPase 7, plasma membrane-type-like [Triticum dicoccoides]|uniref:calcium-transporting ATPase 7, plasma membrane-type-like n=1 Tax=Triticum dicoccoides TaxID=85692 RepID=UPI00188E2775|nr:calcium-transporting ATPase 7, plasma membrane-type-like [Triticum dicoccoides]
MLLAVFLIAVMSAANSHSQAKRFDQVTSESDNIAVTVVRAARRQEVPIFDIVVGDVVILKIGDSVPADGVFLEGHSLLVDESNMTGESHPIEIDAEKNPFLTAGVKIMDGYGRMLVTAVGADTLRGEMMSSITKETIEQTPLQKRLEGLTSSIGKIGVAVGALVFTVLTARHFDHGEPPFGKGQVIFDAVFRSLVVAYAMPEGLPLAVTLSLAYSMRKIVKDKALVRRLSACETMASVTAICTDKTGTLTLNQMKVNEFWVGTDQPGAAMKIAGSVMSLLCQGVGLNTTGIVYKPDIVSPPEITGSSTEKALLSWAVADLGMDSEELKRSCKVVRVEAFNSDKKRSRVMIRDKATGAVMAHWKGDAQMVLANCSTYVDIDGAARELGDEQRKSLEKVIDGMSADSLRCIAFACKQVNGTEQSKIDDEGLTLLGFVGLKDPCRPEVKAGIEACTKAGIAVKMVTGDNILTARAIAKECGIISSDDNPNGIVIEGREFRAMSTREQLKNVDNIRVMARSLPSDKLALVQRLKEKGHVVAVTGGSTNDALALKEADIGLSMGVQGTEVAKESSDIIILNDEFDTVVAVTRWGRCVYNNIQKIIQFELTVNVAALIINFISAITTGKMPLTTGQLLWVNLIMDTMGALALATGTPTKALMENRPPIGRTAPLITNAMWRNLAVQAAFQVAVLLVLQFRGRDLFGADEKANGTMIFNTFVLLQVFNEFNAREIEKKNVFDGLLKNRMFLVIIAMTLVLQVVTMEVLTWFAGTKRLALEQWGVCLAISAMSWPIGWAVKFLPVPDRT